MGRKPALRPAPPCPRCRTENPAGTNFCFSCGSRISDEGPPGSRVTGEIIVTGPAAAARARLVAVRRDGSDGPSYDVTGDQFDVGRSEGDLLFDDPHIAPRHARIDRRGNGFVLTPLENRNGVYARLRQPADLSDGDHVLIGKQVLRFEVPLEVEKVLRPAVENGVVLFGTPLKPPWGRLRQLTSAGTTRDVFHLNRSDVVLGREQGDVVFSDDEFLSRRHAQLQMRAGRISLSDLGSSNGTFLRLRGQYALGQGEMLRMGDELLRFEIG
jgi:pSer/pThr/pTyr-binding forkhead associated (FHA) protein